MPQVASSQAGTSVGVHMLVFVGNEGTPNPEISALNGCRDLSVLDSLGIEQLIYYRGRNKKGPVPRVSCMKALLNSANRSQRGAMRSEKRCVELLPLCVQLPKRAASF